MALIGTDESWRSNLIVNKELLREIPIRLLWNKVERQMISDIREQLSTESILPHGEWKKLSAKEAKRDKKFKFHCLHCGKGYVQGKSYQKQLIHLVNKSLFDRASKRPIQTANSQRLAGKVGGAPSCF